MIIRTGTYEVDRKRLVRWANLTGQLRTFYLDRMAKDLIETGITAFSVQDLLVYMEFIPGQLLDNVDTYNMVYHKCIKLVFNKPKREDLDEISYERRKGL